VTEWATSRIQKFAPAAGTGPATVPPTTPPVGTPIAAGGIAGVILAMALLGRRREQ